MHPFRLLMCFNAHLNHQDSLNRRVHAWEQNAHKAAEDETEDVVLLFLSRARRPRHAHRQFDCAAARCASASSSSAFSFSVL